jgi:hypothetical protein
MSAPRWCEDCASVFIPKYVVPPEEVFPGREHPVASRGTPWSFRIAPLGLAGKKRRIRGEDNAWSHRTRKEA